MRLENIVENDFRLRELVPTTGTNPGATTGTNPGATTGTNPGATTTDPTMQQKLGAKQVVDLQQQRREIQDQINNKKKEMVELQRQAQEEIRNLQQQLNQLT